MPKLAIADAFVDRARVASSEAELFELLLDCCRAVGIRFFALVHHVNFGLERVPAIRLHNYPAAWQRWFDENQLGRSDPVHRVSQLICEGFCWSIVPDLIPMTSIDRSVFSQARVVGNHVAAAQLAVDGEVEKRSVPQSAMLVEPEPDRPDLLRLERSLGADKAAFVPRTQLMESGIQR
jgi:hypothetical protein